jgi:hypothetical protein
MEENILNIYGIYEYGFRELNETNDQFILYLIGLCSLVSYGFTKLFCTKSKSKSINKVLPLNSECLISLEEIGIGDSYYQCDVCTQVYLCEKLDKWFVVSKRLVCPYCQTKSINVNYTYTNK